MQLLNFLLEALRWLVLIDVVLTWVIHDPEQFPRNLTGQITRPLYAPFRALLPPEKTGGFDLSPIGVLLLLSLLQRALFY